MKCEKKKQNKKKTPKLIYYSVVNKISFQVSAYGSIKAKIKSN